MKFSIKFLGIIALSDATQAAFIPALRNTTDVSRAASTNKTGGPEFPVQYVSRRRRGEVPFEKNGKKHCAEIGMWYCYRRQMKHFMKKYHQQSEDPKVAYEWRNYKSGRMKKICKAKHGESRYNMSSSECTTTSDEEFGGNLKEIARELGFPGRKEWNLPNWFDEPTHIPYMGPVFLEPDRNDPGNWPQANWPQVKAREDAREALLARKKEEEDEFWA